MTATLTRTRRLSNPVFIHETFSSENDYVRKDTFDAHMQRIETLIAMNTTEQKSMSGKLEGKVDALGERVNTLEGKVDALGERVGTLEEKVDALGERVGTLEKKVDVLDGKFDVLSERMERVADTLTVAINRTDRRIDDLQQSQNRWFMLLGILVAAMPIAMALIQGITAK